MSSRLGCFVLGIVATIVVFVGGAYVFLQAGGVSMATSSPPLPLETTVAKMAIHASFGDAAQVQNPLPFNDANMLAGAKVFSRHCAVCHGLPGQPPTEFSRGMFPRPPQLFENNQMVTDDPEGISHWKVTNGIRLSGMPAFGHTLSDTQRWQVTMLVEHADKLAPAAKAALAH